MKNEEIVKKGTSKLGQIVEMVKEIYLDIQMVSTEVETKLRALFDCFKTIAEILTKITGKEYHCSSIDGSKFALLIIDIKTKQEDILFQF